MCIYTCAVIKNLTMAEPTGTKNILIGTNGSTSYVYCVIEKRITTKPKSEKYFTVNVIKRVESIYASLALALSHRYDLDCLATENRNNRKTPEITFEDEVISLVTTIYEVERFNLNP